MKKQILFTILLTSLVLFVSFKSNISETELPRKVNPTEILGIELKFSQGYIVLNPSKFENLSYWKLKLTPKENKLKKNKNSKFHSVDKNSKSRIVKLSKNKNYWKLPNDLNQSQYQIAITGFDNKDNEILIATPFTGGGGPNPPPPTFPGGGLFDPTCRWECEGPTYAWKIQKWEHKVTKGYVLTVDHNYDYCVNPNPQASEICYPFYYYMSSNAMFNQYCPSQAWQSYATSCPDLWGVTMVGPFNANNGVYRSATGGLLKNTTVWGVMKNLGPWENSNIHTPWNNVLSGPSCMNNRNWAINTINTYGDFSDPTNTGLTFPKLECIPVSSSHNGGGGIDLGDSYNEFIKQIDRKADFWGFIDTGWGGMIGSGWEQDFHKAFGNIIIRDIGDINNKPIIIDVEKSFDKEGNWKTKKFKLEESLYNIGFTTRDGKYFYLINEFKNKNIQAKDTFTKKRKLKKRKN